MEYNNGGWWSMLNRYLYIHIILSLSLYECVSLLYQYTVHIFIKLNKHQTGSHLRGFELYSSSWGPRGKWKTCAHPILKMNIPSVKHNGRFQVDTSSQSIQDNWSIINITFMVVVVKDEEWMNQWWITMKHHEGIMNHDDHHDDHYWFSWC